MNAPVILLLKQILGIQRMERKGQNNKRGGSLANFLIHSLDPLLRMDPIRHPPEIHQSDFPIYTGSLWCSIWKYLKSSPDTYCPSEVFELSQKYLIHLTAVQHIFETSSEAGVCSFPLSVSLHRPEKQEWLEQCWLPWDAANASTDPIHTRPENTWWATAGSFYDSRIVL